MGRSAINPLQRLGSSAAADDVMAVLDADDAVIIENLAADDELFRGYLPHDGRKVLTNIIWALLDFTVENGATRIVPGSHTWSEGSEPDEDGFAQVVMPHGSLTLYLGSTFRGARRNTTDQLRTGVLFGFSLGWLRQEENQYLSVPPHLAQTLPKSLQELMTMPCTHPSWAGSI